MIKDLTVIIACKDRHAHLDYCVQSIVSGDKLPRLFVVDFGSTPALNYSRFKFIKVFRVDRKTDIFHKARALNIAIKSVRSKFMCVTDSDQIFAPNFFRVVYDTVKKPSAFVYCPTYALPKFPTEYNIAVNDVRNNYAKLLKLAKGNPKQPTAYGDGCCHAMRTKWMQSTRGYDEGFIGWGPEDSDVRFRAKHTGLKFFDIRNKTTMIHLFHKWANKPGEYHDKKSIAKNVAYYKNKRKKGVLIGNNNKWGLM